MSRNPPPSPKLDIKIVPVESLVEDPANARMHPERNLEAIKGSLLRFGMQKPIVISSKNVVIAGNGTLAAARAIGMKEIAVVVSDLKGADAMAFGLVDNRTAEIAEWNEEILAKTLVSLKDEGQILDEIGFDDEFVKDLLAKNLAPIAPGCDEDAVPEESKVEPICKRGEIWKLGNHRLMCGDSTKKEDVERLMGGEKADMVFTDPPYGVKAVGKNGTLGWGNLCAAGVYSPLRGDETTDAAKACYEISLGIGARVICLWGGNYYSEFCPPKACWLAWDKRGDMAGNIFADCELAWTNLDSPARCYKQVWSGMIKEGEKGKRIHPTQKPVALAEWAFGELDPKGKTVLDLFLGSGSTLIACEKTNRRCFGMEIDPHYCDVVIARWEKYANAKAEKIS